MNNNSCCIAVNANTKKNENTNVTSTSKIINFRPGITVMVLTDPDTMRLD